MNTLKLKKTAQKGFTLVEILIVVIIVGLLAGIAVVKLGDSKERAVISVKKNIATELNKAIQSAYVRGEYISGFAVTNDAAGVVSVLNALQAIPNNAPFTTTSAAEMIRGIQDETPGTGSWEVNAANDTDHRNLEIVFVDPS